MRRAIKKAGGQLWTFRTFIIVFICIGLFVYVRLTYRFDLSQQNTETNTSSSSAQISFHTDPLVIWNTDIHPAPVAGISGLLEPMGVRVLKYTLSEYYCKHFNACHERANVKVLTEGNCFDSDKSEFRSKFYDAYKDDPVMKSVDAILCTDFIAICQIYMQFNKPMIIIATTRYYEFRLQKGKEDMPRYHQWNNDLKQIAADPRHFIGANNMYDVKFMRYFTGIEPAYIPTYASYVKDSYNPTKPIYLMAKNRLSVIDDKFCADVNQGVNTKVGNCPTTVERLTGEHQFSDLASYRGIIHIPYQVSTMSIFEQYQLHIPLFFPSKKLLVKWEVENWLLRERMNPGHIRDLETPPHDLSQNHLPSPNDNRNHTAVDYWLQFADYYTLPHIQYFESAEDLAEILCRLTQADLNEISKRMQQYSVELKTKLIQQWGKIMLNVAKYSPNRGYQL